jgi:hypothetical protein
MENGVVESELRKQHSWESRTFIRNGKRMEKGARQEKAGEMLQCAKRLQNGCMVTPPECSIVRRNEYRPWRTRGLPSPAFILD